MTCDDGSERMLTSMRLRDIVRAAGSNSDYGGALTILFGSRSLRERLGQHVRIHSDGFVAIDWDKIMAAAEPFSHGETVLVDLAFHLYSSSIVWYLSDSETRPLEAWPCDWLSKLDDENIELAFLALHVSRGSLTLADALDIEQVAS